MSSEAGPSLRSATKRRAPASAACQRCRQKKMRCDAQRPTCISCARAAADCHYDTIDAGESRAAAARRKTAAAQSQVEEVKQCLVMLQHMPHTEAIGWLQTLRTAADPLDALKTMQSVTETGLRASPPLSFRLSPPLPSTSWSPRTEVDLALALNYPFIYPLLPLEDIDVEPLVSPYSLSSSASAWELGFDDKAHKLGGERSQPGAAASKVALEDPLELVDSRLEQLDIAYWTPVTISNESAARLISLYLVTDHPLLCPFDPDLFVQDLTTRRLDFCSPLLVNSLLAWACRTHAAAVDPSIVELAESFSAVAARLLKGEEFDHSILTVASLLCLTVSTISAGSDDDARAWLDKMIHMAIAMRLFGENRAGPEKFEWLSWEQGSAYTYAAWGAYNFANIYLAHYRVPAWGNMLCRPPNLPIPGNDTTTTTAPANDPKAFRPRPPPSYMGQTFGMYCRLLPINQEILAVYIDPGGPPASHVPLALAEAKLQKLLDWSSRLPPSLTCTSDMPHHVCVLHASFHAMVMELLRPFLFRDLRLSSTPGPHVRPEEVFLASAMRMAETARLYCVRFHGLAPSRAISSFILPVYTIHVSLHGDQNTRAQRRRDFELCVRAFADLGVAAPMKTALIRGSMAMAVARGLFSRAESSQMLAVLALSRNSDHDLKRISLLVDFDRAMNDPAHAHATFFAGEYAAMEAEGF